MFAHMLVYSPIHLLMYSRHFISFINLQSICYVSFSSTTFHTLLLFIVYSSLDRSNAHVPHRAIASSDMPVIRELARYAVLNEMSAEVLFEKGRGHIVGHVRGHVGDRGRIERTGHWRDKGGDVGLPVSDPRTGMSTP
jgi:hypothetical protein